MKTHPFRPLTTPLGVLLLLGLSSPGDELGLAPEPGTELTKVLHESVEWSLETMDMRADGSTVEQLLPEVTGVADRRILVRDTYAKLEDGRLLELSRSFEELEMSSSFDVDDQGTQFSKAVRCESPLTGETVIFTWDEEEEEHVARFENDSTDGALLEGLDIDMDLRAFLPTEEVDAGDTWEVDGAHVASLFHAGGDVKFFPAEADRGSLFTIPTAVVIASAFASIGESAGTFDGEVQARYTGMVEVDGEQLARIELELEITSETDRTDRYIEFVERADEESDTSSLALAFELDFEAKGTLLWNPKKGHAASLQLTAEFALVTDMAWKENAFGEEFVEVEGDFEVQGTSELTLTVE